jgi:hypothetical protein
MPGVKMSHNKNQLPADISLVHIQQNIAAYDTPQIALHEIEHHIYIKVVRRFMNSFQFDDMRTASQLLQKAYFAKRPLCIGRIAKSTEHLLESYESK